MINQFLKGKGDSVESFFFLSLEVVPMELARVSAEDLHLSDEYIRGGIIEAKEQLLMQLYTKQMESCQFFQQI